MDGRVLIASVTARLCRKRRALPGWGAALSAVGSRRPAAGRRGSRESSRRATNPEPSRTARLHRNQRSRRSRGRESRVESRESGKRPPQGFEYGRAESFQEKKDALAGTTAWARGPGLELAHVESTFARHPSSPLAGSGIRAGGVEQESRGSTSEFSFGRPSTTSALARRSAREHVRRLIGSRWCSPKQWGARQHPTPAREVLLRKSGPSRRALLGSSAAARCASPPCIVAYRWKGRSSRTT